MSEEKVLSHKRYTPIKKRGGQAYHKKVERITKWYNHLIECREKEPKINPHNQLPYKRKDLKSLDYYISKIKPVTN